MEACVCTPISAADGSRHRNIHRYMPIYYISRRVIKCALFHTAADSSGHTDIYTDIYRYISRRVLSVHSSTPPLTAPGATSV